MNRYTCIFISVLLALSCGAPPGGNDGGLDGGIDAGVKYTLMPGFNARPAGWPAGKAMIGAALYDGVVYAADDTAIHALALTEMEWKPVTLALETDEKFTSLQRLDQTIVATVAGTSTGSLYLKPSQGDFAKSTTAPTGKLWAVVKKNSDFLLASTGGIYAASDLAGTWTRRSTTNSGNPLGAKVTRFVAGAGQLRMFITGDKAQSFGGLYQSDDNGVTWSPSLVVHGIVNAIGADGTAVLVDTTVDAAMRSDNYGNTFKAMDVGAEASGFVFSGGHAWAATPGGLRTTADLGASWSNDSQANVPTSPIRGMFVSGSLLVIDTEAGPYLSTVQ